MNIVLVTTGKRLPLLRQSMNSIKENAADWEAHPVVVVLDNPDAMTIPPQPQRLDTLIINPSPQGASASRNIGAGSIPKYRRQEHVLFLDDDVFMCPGWDTRLMELARESPIRRIMSAYSHPFNHCEPVTGKYGLRFGVPLVISSVAMMMPWSIWDEVGPFDEPGGPGGSEDFALCMRAKDRGYGFAVTEPQCILHCGVTNSSGKPIVGQKESIELNERLIAQYGLEEKVTIE